MLRLYQTRWVQKCSEVFKIKIYTLLFVSSTSDTNISGVARVVSSGSTTSSWRLMVLQVFFELGVADVSHRNMNRGKFYRKQSPCTRSATKRFSKHSLATPNLRDWPFHIVSCRFRAYTVIQCISRNVYSGGPDSIPFCLFWSIVARFEESSSPS